MLGASMTSGHRKSQGAGLVVVRQDLVARNELALGQAFPEAHDLFAQRLHDLLEVNLGRAQLALDDRLTADQAQIAATDRHVLVFTRFRRP